ncbi:hypothetical protein [Hymenobacter cavernae]|uniref:hypothetical protein n=1 Tax=Hymenobacter cavernae TaxID=2044852 RepID=UPI00166D778A|nr:hypothetical protein [Hymenobacter cavernae]
MLLRRAAVLASVSFGLALLLVAYLFGTSDAFFTRLFGAFFVFFWLLAVTFLGVVPFVNWAAANWFGKGWSEITAASSRQKSRTSPAASSSATRKAPNVKTSGTTKRLN